MKLTSQEIVQAVQTPQHCLHREVIPAGYSIDSRTLSSGDCFIAIQGKNFDGHQFIPEALRKGACLVIARSDFPITGDVPVVRVPDTLSALQQLANYTRRKWGKKVIGITGSTGKTTTKEIAAFVLGAKFRVFKSVGNFNNDYGLPLSLLRLHEADDLAVLELGMSHRGEIARLSRIAQPDLGIVTNIKPVHLEFFDSMEGIAQAKRELVEALPRDGVAILNNDDARIRKFGRFSPSRVLTFGIESAAGYHVSDIVVSGLQGCSFQVEHKGQRHPMFCPLLGTHNVSNCLPAIVLAHHLGLPFGAIAERISQLIAYAGRGEVLHFTDGFAVINDSYNSNPAALETMLDFLKRVPGFKRKILVAGEMLELGTEGAAFHRQCGRAAAKAKLDMIVGVQGLAKLLVEAARHSGYDASRAQYFEDSISAGAWLSQQVQPGDLILVKGSRGVLTERTIETLKQKHPQR